MHGEARNGDRYDERTSTMLGRIISLLLTIAIIVFIIQLIA